MKMTILHPDSSHLWHQKSSYLMTHHLVCDYSSFRLAHCASLRMVLVDQSFRLIEVGPAKFTGWAGVNILIHINSVVLKIFGESLNTDKKNWIEIEKLKKRSWVKPTVIKWTYHDKFVVFTYLKFRFCSWQLQSTFYPIFVTKITKIVRFRRRKFENLKISKWRRGGQWPEADVISRQKTFPETHHSATFLRHVPGNIWEPWQWQNLFWGTCLSEERFMMIFKNVPFNS